MGFFSWDCKVCGHPMLSVYAISAINSWMNDVVVLTPSGGLHAGEYDGYGRVDEASFYDGGPEPECYHRHCWELAGKPTKFTKASRYSSDQGFFFDDDDHAIEPPAKLPKKMAPRAKHTILGDRAAKGIPKD